MIPSWLIAWRFARRDLRGGLAGLRTFLACLILGVAAIAAVGSSGAAIQGALRAEARTILGGDLDVQQIHRPLPAELDGVLAARGARRAALAEMRAMLQAATGAAPATLANLKAVDGAWPLAGSVLTDPALPLDALLAPRDGVHGAILEAALAERLGVRLGDRLRLGGSELELRALLRREPDRALSGISFAPRAVVSLAALRASGLIQPGALINFHLRAILPDPAAAEQVKRALTDAFPDAGWRVRTASEASPAAGRFIARITLFLGLVGLTALLVGGVGIANAITGYLAGRQASIATLKCLGAPRGLIFRVYLLVVGVIALAGVALGLALGALAPLALAGLGGDLLPVPVRAGLYPAPLLIAGAFGLLTALAAALWPLGRACEIPGAALFRDTIAPQALRPSWAIRLGLGACLLAVLALAVVSTPEPRLALWFAAGAGLSFALLRLLAVLVLHLARRLGRPRNLRLRLALDAVRRPGAPSAAILLSLGLGLTVLQAVVAIDGGLNRQIAEDLPARAPAFFLVDIQPDQVGPLTAAIAALPGVGEIERMAALRGRISHIKGVPVAQAAVGPDAAWALDSDRGLTSAATPPPRSEIVAGAWWPADYRGPPLISFDAALAEGMGVGVGDSLTINVLGRPVVARIANLRRINWRSLGINFAIIFSPGFLEGAPHTHLATVQATPAAEGPLIALLARSWPNVSALRVRDALETAASVLNGIAAAADVTAGITVAAGVLVLAGAIAAGQQRRRREAVMLKVLGARRRDLTLAAALEFLLLGLIAALPAMLLGQIAAWGVLRFAMGTPWVADIPAILAVTLGALGVTVLVGLLGSWRALGQRPAPALREA